MSLVWTTFPRGGSEKLVLLALADWANDDGGSIHPSMAAIAKKSCLRECQARRIVHKFIDEGLLEVVGNEHGGAPGTTRQYRLNMAKLQTAVPESTPRIEATPVLQARDGSTGVPETGLPEESQTTIEPSKNHQKSLAKVSRLPDTPYDRLVEAYHEALPKLPRCMVLSDARKRHIRARWEFWRGEGKYSTVDEGLTWWRRFFCHVGESHFLTGQVEPREGRRPFVADIDFIMNPEKNILIFEGKYHEAAA